MAHSGPIHHPANASRWRPMRRTASVERPNAPNKLGRKADSIGHGAVPSWSGMRATRPPVSLTPRQRQVLSLMAEGKTTREIAYELGLSPFTVKNYIQRIYERLRVL